MNNKYQSTQNYLKAASDYNIGQNRTQKRDEGLMSMYNLFKTIGQGKQRINQTNLGINYAKNIDPSGELPKYVTEAGFTPETIQSIASSTPSQGLLGQVKSLAMPSATSNSASQLGKAGMDAGIAAEGTAGASSTVGALGSMGYAMPVLAALLMLGKGIGKDGSWLAKTFNPNGGYVK